MYGGILMEEGKVAVLLEDLRSQFRVFGEGLAGLHDEMKVRFDTLENKLDGHIEQNRLEHQQIMQMITEVDREVQTEIKRVK
jgi:hypothetical protein